MIHKDTVIANIFSAGALTAFLANIETGLTLAILCTALFINVRKIYRDLKKDKEES